jgi:hypothetical protein
MVSLTALRKASLPDELRGHLAKWLLDLSQLVAGDRLEQAPYGVVVALVGQDGPEITWRGHLTYEELSEVEMALREQRCAQQFKKEVQDVVRQSRERKAREVRDHDAYLAEHPWLCAASPTCWKRFKTEYGAKIHERRCRYLKREQARAV